MIGSRMIRVIKRDGSEEPFDAPKLGAAVWRAMGRAGGHVQASQLATVVQFYLARRSPDSVSSAAVFEMANKALRCVHLDDAADAMERYWRQRLIRRRVMRVVHDNGSVTLWDKRWVIELGRRLWRLSPVTARILAGKVERQLLGRRQSLLTRQEVLDALNTHVCQWGLADAVPVET